MTRISFIFLGGVLFRIDESLFYLKGNKMTTAAISDSTGISGNKVLKKVLLFCGIISSLFYIGMNVFIPMLYAGYNSFTQTVSELSAIGTPTRQVWVNMALFYTMLLIAFGFGILKTANQIRNLRIVGILVIIHAVIGIFWPPMHQREVLAAGGGTITDTLHIVWTMITVPFFMLEIGFGAAAFGKRFRWYSIITVIIIIFFGMLTGIGSRSMEANLPTPWLGVWERIIIGGYMIWVIVFAISMMKMENISGHTVDKNGRG
jgi:hypothetical protein